ncbi:hypothetical protein Tco_1497168, partial [Tanacetum coccineum]
VKGSGVNIARPKEAVNAARPKAAVNAARQKAVVNTARPDSSPVRFSNLQIYMLVEKKYPLIPATITDMLNKKLHADHLNEMCYQLLKLITKQLKNERSV